MQQKYPNIRVVIGLWTSKGDLKQAKARVSCDEKDAVVSSFSDGIHEIEQLAHPLLLAKSNQESAEEQQAKTNEVSKLTSASKVGAAAERR